MCIPQGTLLGLTLHIAHVQHWTCSADRIPFLKGLIWSKTIKSKPIQALCKLAMSANKGTSRTPNDYAHTHTRTELHQETCGRMHCEMCNKWLALREQRLLQYSSPVWKYMVLEGTEVYYSRDVARAPS